MQDRLSYCHRGGNRPLRGLTLDGWFKESLARFPDHLAIVSEHQRARLSYVELDDTVQRVARSLLGIGITRGDRVGIWATDNLEWVLLQLATARIGAVLVNINPAYRASELEYALKAAEVQALFLMPSFRTSNYVEMVLEVCPEAGSRSWDALHPAATPQLRRIAVYDPAAPTGTEKPASGFLPWGDFLEAGESVPSDEVRRVAEGLDPDDPINIQFTSGTTGFPKAVLLTHHNIGNNGYGCGEVMGFTAEDRLCVPVPFYHCFGMVVANLACFTHGAAVVIPSPHFEPAATLDTIEAEDCTAVHGVPTMFVAMLEENAARPRELSSLRTGIMAGAPCPPELIRRVVEELRCREILIGYGQTEASPVTHCTRPLDSLERRTQTVGTNLPHTECKVVDVTTGSLLPRGTQGEVCFRGYHVMRGYYGNDEATRETVDDSGWLHSGDLGVMDPEGYMSITGRLKDMIIRGGENIYPAEIEAWYYGHPEVAEIAVFGVPDPVMGEEVAAFVRLHERAHTTAGELRDFAREKIAHFKIPRYFWFVDEFPMTITGKIQKFRMREIASEWLRSEGNPGG